MNLVFIFTDQQRYDTIGTHSSRKLRTPNLDRLAGGSVLFDRAYVSQPVCTPSRATIVTGLYPHSHRLITNNLILADEIPTIADLAKDGGFDTAYMGKWHLGNEVIQQHGFDTWVSTEDNYRRHYGREEYKAAHSQYDAFLRSSGFKPDREDEDFTSFSRDFATRIPEEFSKPAFTAREADRYIEGHQDKPFMLYINFLEPHPPYLSAFDEMYSPEDIDLPFNFEEIPPEDAPLKYASGRFHARHVGRHFPLADEKTWRKQIARYWGQVTLMDKYTGEILNSLERHGVADRTVVVFTSDHGDMMGDFRMLGKGVMHDSSARVPLLIRVPGVTDKPRTVQEPVGQVDLVPTLLDLLGLPPYRTVQGKSLTPIVRGEEVLQNNDVFIEYQLGVQGGAPKKKRRRKPPEISGDPAVQEEALRMKREFDSKYGKPVAERTVVSGDGFKLCLNEAGESQLYDLNSDPRELRNLFKEAAHRDRIEDMRNRIIEWQKETGDTATI